MHDVINECSPTVDKRKQLNQTPQWEVGNRISQVVELPHIDQDAEANTLETLAWLLATDEGFESRSL